MNQSTSISSVQDLISAAQQILVIVSPKPNLDLLAASSSFYLALLEQNRDVIYAIPQKPNLSSTHSELSGVEALKTKINNKNLIVSFDYEPTAVEKVSYHIGQETNRFYLTVEPQKNHQPLDKKTVEINYAGVEADLIILFGISEYEALGELYLGNEQLFNNTNVVTLHNFKPEIGQIKLTTDNELNYSSAVINLIQELNLSLSADAATNLLLSLEAETNSFSSLATTPKVFEQTAWLMRQGARRIRQKINDFTDETAVNLVDELSQEE